MDKIEKDSVHRVPIYHCRECSEEFGERCETIGSPCDMDDEHEADLVGWAEVRVESVLYEEQ